MSNICTPPNYNVDINRRGKRFLDLVADAKAQIQEISKDELKAWLESDKDFRLVDVRESDEYANGKIGDAISLPRGILELKIDDALPNQDDVVVLYCGGGNRSALAAEMVQKMGYANVYSLAGGWRAWNQ